MQTPTQSAPLNEEIEWTRGEIHPAGIFRAEFTGWSLEMSEQWGKQVKLSFITEAVDSDGKPCGISVWTKPSLHPKGRIAKLLGALGVDAKGIDLKTFSLNPYRSKRLRIGVEHYTATDGSEKAKIGAFYPLEQTNVKPDPKWDEN